MMSTRHRSTGSPARSREPAWPGGVDARRHHLMIGVPRLDGVHSANDLVPAMSAAVQEIAARHTDEAPRVRVLPERIYLHQLDPTPTRTGVRLPDALDDSASACASRI